MQRPRMTDRAAKALGYARGHLTAIYEDMTFEGYSGDGGHSAEDREDMKRAIDFLEESIQWQRARAKSR